MARDSKITKAADPIAFSQALRALELLDIEHPDSRIVDAMARFKTTREIPVDEFLPFFGSVQEGIFQASQVKGNGPLTGVFCALYNKNYGDWPQVSLCDPLTSISLDRDKVHRLEDFFNDHPERYAMVEFIQPLIQAEMITGGRIDYVVLNVGLRGLGVFKIKVQQYRDGWNQVSGAGIPELYGRLLASVSRTLHFDPEEAYRVFSRANRFIYEEQERIDQKNESNAQWRSLYYSFGLLSLTATGALSLQIRHINSINTRATREIGLADRVRATAVEMAEKAYREQSAGVMEARIQADLEIERVRKAAAAEVAHTRQLAQAEIAQARGQATAEVDYHRKMAAVKISNAENRAIAQIAAAEATGAADLAHAQAMMSTAEEYVLLTRRVYMAHFDIRSVEAGLSEARKFDQMLSNLNKESNVTKGEVQKMPPAEYEVKVRSTDSVKINAKSVIRSKHVVVEISGNGKVHNVRIRISALRILEDGKSMGLLAKGTSRKLGTVISQLRQVIQEQATQLAGMKASFLREFGYAFSSKVPPEIKLRPPVKPPLPQSSPPPRGPPFPREPAPFPKPAVPPMTVVALEPANPSFSSSVQTVEGEVALRSEWDRVKTPGLRAGRIVSGGLTLVMGVLILKSLLRGDAKDPSYRYQSDLRLLFRKDRGIDFFLFTINNHPGLREKLANMWWMSLQSGFVAEVEAFDGGTISDASAEVLIYGPSPLPSSTP